MPKFLKHIATLSIIVFFNLIAFHIFANDINKSESTKCDDSKKTYKICSNQEVEHKKIRTDAIKQNKLVLIVFGAEWCPWCKSMHMIFQNDDFKKEITSSMIPYETGVYQYNSKQPVESGIKILNQYLSLKKLEYKDYKSVPLIAVIKPNNDIKKDKVVFIKTGDLEHNTETTQGHDPAKVLAALKSAQSKVLE